MTASGLSSPFVALAPRALFEISDAASVEIRCVEGSLWITLDHDPRDIILEPGERFQAEHASRALVYGLEASRFMLQPVLAQPLATAPPRPLPYARAVA